MTERRILHVDFNGFYASVACFLDPSLRGKAVAVAGDPAARHGIILAKNEEAKRFGVKTGEVLWQAKRKCPELIAVPPQFDQYMRFSKLGREIYAAYSDRVEPFGLDESWIDVTECTSDFQDAEQVANEIRHRVLNELGITVSVGAAPNKIFAKLGSDLSKADRVTVITAENYQDTVWPLPVRALLFVGPSTEVRLRRIGVRSIGELAMAPAPMLQSVFGKTGLMLHDFANGLDDTPVERFDAKRPAKSVGNGVTAPRDLVNESDVYLTIAMLCESIAARLRENGQKARTVHLALRDTALMTVSRQAKLDKPSNLTMELAELSMQIFRKNYDWHLPLRSLTVTVGDLIDAYRPVQLSLLTDDRLRERALKAEAAVDDIRRRFGYHSITRALFLTDADIGRMNPREENIFHPVGWHIAASGEQEVRA